MFRPLAPVDLVISGPTASGKSRFAIAWAKQFNAEVISADSRQVYRELSIGTGKPSPQEREEIPHHLLDRCSVTETYSAGDFVRDARSAIRDIQERGKRVIVCGGTGLYIKALLGGLVELPKLSSSHYESFRRQLETVSTESLHDRLCLADPSRARAIHPHDRVRILRGLYLLEQFSLPPTELYERFRGQGIPANRVVGLDPGRESLYAGIAMRVSRMLQEGWVDEVDGLLKAGIPPDSAGFNSLGYREVIDCLCGRAPWADLEERIIVKTRQYAKRQLTWFRHMDQLMWIHPEESGSFSLEPPSNYGTIKTISHNER